MDNLGFPKGHGNAFVLRTTVKLRQKEAWVIDRGCFEGTVARHAAATEINQGRDGVRPSKNGETNCSNARIS